MGADIYKAKYEFLLGSISQEQFDFIDDVIYRSDDGTYELSGEHYLELTGKKEELEKQYKTGLNSILQVFKEETKNGKNHLTFRIFE